MTENTRTMMAASDVCRDIDRALGSPRLSSYHALIAQVQSEHESLQKANALLRELWVAAAAHIATQEVTES